jgi:hypothetical protein
MTRGGCSACEPNLIVGMGFEDIYGTSGRVVWFLILNFQATLITFLSLSFTRFGWSVPYFLSYPVFYS